MVAWAIVVALVVGSVVGGRGTRTPGLITLALVMAILAGAFVMLAPTPTGYDELADSDRLGGNLMAIAGPRIAAAMFLVSLGSLGLSLARWSHEDG
jgi:hypothetical protein